MSFDKPTRNALAGMVGTCRKLLGEDYTDQLRGEYGMHPDGLVLDLSSLQHLDPTGIVIAQQLREELVHLEASSTAKAAERHKDAYERLVRELGFTAMNRLAALRMCEERGLIAESVHKGHSSEGATLFARIMNNAVGDAYATYRLYLELLFDELAVDLGVLFDRTHPTSLLFPSDKCLTRLLGELNAPAFEHLWANDETIGWIYQYWNSADERRAMRNASAAPRDSRELAVRNQFFTPRCVVEFLTDNTLGRVWYEMRKAETRLVDECQYMLRRPREIFLGPVEEPPAEPEQDDGLSQEQLLKQPAHILHREKKLPWEIKVLDPAVGSAHFLLYCFDLLETIYDEAFDDPELGPQVRARHPDREEYRRDVPAMILAYNLHGIDIDPRCAQIASLALWLRAQRAYRELGLPRGEYPQIRRTNIVCAEPMPGEESLLDEYCASLSPSVLGDLVRVIWDKMKLAGEAGCLLKVEEEIRDAVRTAEEAWRKAPKAWQINFFDGQVERPAAEQAELTFSGPTTAEFWHTAEDLLFDALKAFSAHTEGVKRYTRRLFADDAASGFAFIDICRRHYDVVLMNPPFGEPTAELLGRLDKTFRDINKNLLCAFLKQGYEMLCSSGRLGAIYDRTAAVKNSYEVFRRSFLFCDTRLAAHADLGWEVLDANVEVTMSVLCRDSSLQLGAFLDVRNCRPQHKGPELQLIVSEFAASTANSPVKLFPGTVFAEFPNAVLGHDFPPFVVAMFGELPNLAEQGVQVIAGHTILAERFFRYWWELPLKDAFRRASPWQRFYNGGEYCRFNSPLCDAVLYGSSGELIVNQKSTILRNPALQQKGKIGFGKRGDSIDAHVLPAGFVSSVEGQAVVLHGDADAFATLALLNSNLFQAVINLYCGQHKYPGYVHLFPCTNWTNEDLLRAGRAACRAFWAKDRLESADEANPRFFHRNALRFWDPAFFEHWSAILTEVALAEDEMNQQMERAYGLDAEGMRFVAETTRKVPVTGGWLSEDVRHFWAESSVLFCLGCVFGRWDVRVAVDPSHAPLLQDPFETLPICSPGMLIGTDGLPAWQGGIASEGWMGARPNPITLPPERSVSRPTIADSEYPIRIDWDGILVDDPEHAEEDIVQRVREVLELVWKARALAMEQEACDILGVRGLRDYFCKPAGFFADHLKHYSKSRRQAPIYWPLSTASGLYTLWVYYHRLSDDFLYRAVNNYVEPKIAQTQRQIAALEAKLLSGATGDARRELEDQRKLFEELQDFRNELLRVADLPYKPNLNDGVLITAAPLWKLFRLPKWRKDLEACWKKLEAGAYDWAHLAYSIWPDRVRKACETDRSIAIAHKLEHLCKAQVPPKSKRKVAVTPVDEDEEGDPDGDDQ
jgi:hypothetical protein